MSEETTWEELLETAGDAATDGGPGREPLPDNDYVLEVKSAKYKKAQTGSDMWNLKLEVLSGPFKGRWVWDNIVLKKTSAGSVKWFFGKMKALGVQPSFFKTQPSNDEVAAAVVGAVVKATIGRQDGDDRYNEVKKYLGSAEAPESASANETPAATPEAATPAPAPASGDATPALPKSPFS